MGLPSIGPLELIIILAIALLIVGPGRLPEMGSAIGRTIREFRKASSDVTDAAAAEPRGDQPSQQQPNTLSRQVTPNSVAVAAAPSEPPVGASNEPALRSSDRGEGAESKADSTGSA